MDRSLLCIFVPVDLRLLALHRRADDHLSHSDSCHSVSAAASEPEKESIMLCSSVDIRKFRMDMCLRCIRAC